jgi:AcrR family transcriptional regulator
MGTVTARRHTPRADALRNHERIVAAAREMFVEFGPEVPFDEIARRAGVGNATVYRHFPDRDELVRHVVRSVLDHVAEHAERATEAADAPGGDAFGELRGFVHAAADERIGALCPLLTAHLDTDDPAGAGPAGAGPGDRVDEDSGGRAGADPGDRAGAGPGGPAGEPGPDAPDAGPAAARSRLESLIEGLLARARATGQLRDDIAVGDLLVALSQLTRPLPGTACPGIDRYVHRHLELFLDGLMAPARSALPGTAATLEDLRSQARCRS